VGYENKKKENQKITIKRVLKIIEILIKCSVIVLSIYAIINRMQDINGIDFFFTTWK
jgi:hypothetical protein